MIREKSMWGKTNDITSAEQEIKEKASNKVTREDGNLPQSPAPRLKINIITISVDRSANT